ncbi:MAG TPA: secondary thiamine-phosphate synthase enzyme YjbQ [Cyclobacteriaceae bacterium]
MIIKQQKLRLAAHSRGFHLISDKVYEGFPEIQAFSTGMLNIFIQHTSASISINENADPTVRLDFESHFNEMVPERAPYYKHTFEGSDDMPAHIKTSLIGSSLNIPISDGKLVLGTWQGIYLCEHRNNGGARTIMLTAWGEKK